MTDKKFSDEEIIKALECCSKHKDLGDCDKCPLYPRYCKKNLLEGLAFDLINRQKAEIERLITLNSQLEAKVFEERKELAKAKTEVAIEIFAEIDRVCVDDLSEFDFYRYHNLRKRYTEGEQ